MARLEVKVKGTPVTLKRRTTIKTIRLTSDEVEIGCNAENQKLVLKTCLLKNVWANFANPAN